MRILFCNGSLFQKNSFSGGSELSFEYLAHYLSKKHQIHVVTRHKKRSVVRKKQNKKMLISYVHDDRVDQFLNHELDAQRYDFVFTQLIWSEIAMGVCAQRNIPCVYFVRSTGVKIDLSKKNKYAPTIMVANSNFARTRIRQLYKRDSLVLYPCIDFKRVRVKGKKQGDFVGMFNPVKVKGGDMFFEIARSNPDKKFLAVRGWTNLRKQNNDWDMETMRLMTRAHGEQGAYAPEETDLGNIPNIRIINPSSKPAAIFSKLKLLLIPSLWEETFCRVMLEAMANGIPVIASKRSGMIEASRFGKGAILVKDYKSIKAWNREMNHVHTNSELCHSLSVNGRKVIRSFRTDAFINEFINRLADFRTRKLTSL